ncbi:general substrate transporter [Podospora australis]|uniref:General substrate transporter n=1 Tax=Podospora australis TaxID=1536484 RepID=A0AAN6WRT6_9PEZI|nr:general substrate transporter [Podospora australis]
MGSSTTSSSGGRALHLPINSLWANRKCVLTCAVVSIANMQYGLDSSCLASLQAMPGFLKVFGYPDPKLNGGYGIDRTFQQLIGSLLTLGAFLSCLLAGTFAAYLGRRPALWAACFLTALGAAIQIGTTSQGVVYLGRFVIGIGNGWLVIFSNIYCAEAAPAHLRAILVGLFTQWVTTGTIVGAVTTWATSRDLGKGSYQIPLGIQFIVPALLSVGLWFVPESPRWLVNRGRLQDARKALERLRGDSLSKEELELEWVETVKGIEEERKMAGGVTALDMFRGTNRRRTLLCFAVIIAQISSGVWFTISYSTYFFVVSGLGVEEAFRFNILKSSVGIIGVQVGMYLMRYVVGRRTILMLGGLFQGLCMLGLGITASTTVPGSPVSRSLVVTYYYYCSYTVGGLASIPMG